MKIIIPTEEKSMAAAVCPSFGRAPFFILYDTDSKKATYLDNSAAAASGGAGIKAAQLIVDSGAEVVITPRCGENAAEVLKGAKIRLYKSQDGCLEDNINLFCQCSLTELLETHPGLHRHG